MRRRAAPSVRPAGSIPISFALMARLAIVRAASERVVNGRESGEIDACDGGLCPDRRPGGGADLLIQFLPFVLIFVIMYFLIIRPQRQKAQRHRDMVANLRRGDTVVTAGGLIGKVSKVVDENELQIEVAEGVKVRAVRGMIAEVRAKGEPVKDSG